MININFTHKILVILSSNSHCEKNIRYILQPRTLKKLIRVLSVAVLCVGFIEVSTGATLSAWDVNGVEVEVGTGIDEDTSPYSFTAETQEENVSDAKLTLSSSVNESTSVGQYGFKISGSDENTTLTGAINDGHYMQFIIKATDGYVMDLNALEMNGQSSGTGADNVSILADMDGNGWDTGDDIESVSNISAVTGGFDTDSSGFGGPIDLTGSQYQGISDVTFRLYGWNTSSGSGVTYLRDLSGNDLVVTGELKATPEPSTFCLFLFGAVTLLTTRCRRKRNV